MAWPDGADHVPKLQFRVIPEAKPNGIPEIPKEFLSMVSGVVDLGQSLKNKLKHQKQYIYQQ